MNLSEDKLRELADSLRVFTNIDPEVLVTVSALETLLPADLEAELCAWRTEDQAVHVLATVGERLVSVVVDGRELREAWAVNKDRVRRVDAVTFSERERFSGLEWHVLEWRITLDDGTQFSPVVTNRGAFDRIANFVLALLP